MCKHRLVHLCSSWEGATAELRSSKPVIASVSMQLHARAELGRGGGESSEILEENTLIHTCCLWQTTPHTHKLL